MDQKFHIQTSEETCSLSLDQTSFFPTSEETIFSLLLCFDNDLRSRTYKQESIGQVELFVFTWANQSFVLFHISYLVFVT